MPSTFAPTCSLCGLRSATRSGHSWSCVSVTTTFSRTAAANQVAIPVAPWTSQPRAGTLSREAAWHPGRPLLPVR